MNLDQAPTAAASYTRTLIARGCPPRLAVLAGNLLARTDDALEYTRQEKELIGRAYGSLAR